MIRQSRKSNFETKVLRAACMAAAIAMLAAYRAESIDLGNVVRDMRNASEASRHGKALYDQVQSITKATTTARRDTLPADGTNVVFYSTSSCGYCKQAREYMDHHGIAFVEYDIQTSERGREDFQSLGAQGVPVLLIGKQRMNGWSEGHFRELYDEFKRSDKTIPAARATRSGTPSSISAGTVLSARIDNVAVFASSSRDSAVVMRLRKGEEVVASAETEGEMIAVESAAGSGWVAAKLVGAP